MTQPTWLAERQQIHARHWRATTCRHCGRPVLRGLDNDTLALDATTDPDPVGPATELRALLAGATSYDLIGPDLHRRDRWNLRGPHRWPVLLAHDCGRRRR